MSEISINTVENIDEVEQKSLLITCTKKLQRYYRVTLHFLDFRKFHHPLLSTLSLLLASREYDDNT